MIPTTLHLCGYFDEWKALHPGFQFPKAVHDRTAECAKHQTDKYVQRRIRAIECLYQFGGVMVAEDSQPRVDISELIRKQNEMNMEGLWIAWDGKQCLSSYMAALPGHPAVLRILDRLSDIRCALPMAKLDELVDIECRKAMRVSRMQAEVVYGDPKQQVGLIIKVEQKPVPAKPQIPATEPYPCLRRGNELAAVSCPICHSKKVMIRTWDCIAHQRCHSSGRDIEGVKACRGCKERVVPNEKVQIIPFEAMCNKYMDGTGWIIGRGPTDFDFNLLRKIPKGEPVFFINDAAQLEHLVQHDQTFFCALDVPVANGISTRINSMFVSGVLWNDWDYSRAQRVVECRRAPKNAEQMLSWDRLETMKHRQVYRTWGTIVSVIHFAWYAGCTTLRLVGCDGLPSTDSRDHRVAYDQRLRQFHNKQPGAAYVALRKEADRVMKALGLTSHYVGTPKGKPLLANEVVVA